MRWYFYRTGRSGTRDINMKAAEWMSRAMKGATVLIYVAGENPALDLHLLN